MLCFVRWCFELNYFFAQNFLQHTSYSIDHTNLFQRVNIFSPISRERTFERSGVSADGTWISAALHSRVQRAGAAFGFKKKITHGLAFKATAFRWQKDENERRKKKQNWKIERWWKKPNRQRVHTGNRKERKKEYCFEKERDGRSWLVS